MPALRENIFAQTFDGTAYANSYGRETLQMRPMF